MQSVRGTVGTRDLKLRHFVVHQHNQKHVLADTRKVGNHKRHAHGRVNDLKFSGPSNTVPYMPFRVVRVACDRDKRPMVRIVLLPQ